MTGKSDGAGTGLSSGQQTSSVGWQTFGKLESSQQKKQGKEQTHQERKPLKAEARALAKVQKSASNKDIQEERLAKVMKKSSSDIRPRKTAAFGT